MPFVCCIWYCDYLSTCLVASSTRLILSFLPFPFLLPSFPAPSNSVNDLFVCPLRSTQLITLYKKKILFAIFFSFYCYYHFDGIISHRTKCSLIKSVPPFFHSLSLSASLSLPLSRSLEDTRITPWTRVRRSMQSKKHLLLFGLASSQLSFCVYCF